MSLVAAIAASSSGANAVVAAASGIKYRVLGFVLSFSGTVNAKWQSGSTDRTGLFYGVANVVVASPALPVADRQTRPTAQFETSAGEALTLNLSGAVAVGGYVVYERLPAGA